MPRGAPSWRGASADAPGPGDPGPPGVIVRAVRRKPDNASSRRVTPLMSRGGKREERRANPRAQANNWGERNIGLARLYTAAPAFAPTTAMLALAWHVLCGATWA